MADKTFKLNTGAEMPAIGLGTWQGEPEKIKTAVSYAVQNGYKLVDCAYCYGNEDSVGEGLKDAFAAGVKREDIFVTSKVWTTYINSDERVELALNKSLTSLGLDYLDLFLIHWPVAMNPNGNHDKFPTLPDGSRDIFRDFNHIDAWKSMEKLLASGKVKAIGVCNYSKTYLEALLAEAKVVPAVNQIENHPSLPQDEIVDLCKAKGIHVMAYSPFGSTGAPMFTAPAIVKVAEKHGVAPGTVLLSYHIARGSTVLAKSTSAERIKSNLTTVELDAEDVKTLADYSADLVAKGELKRYVYPAFNVAFGFPDKS